MIVKCQKPMNSNIVNLQVLVYNRERTFDKMLPWSDTTPLECRFHDLRHTAASRMLKAKVPITTVAKILGWSASTMVSMAKRYSHYLVDDLRDAMEHASENTAQFTAYPNRPAMAEDGNIGNKELDASN
jgi:integrase